MPFMADKNTVKAFTVGIGSVVMALFTIIPFSSFSLYLRPISETLGVSVASVSVLFSISSLGGLVTALLVGRILKLIHPKILVIWGGCVTAAFLIAVSFAKSMVPMYIAIVFQGTGGILAGMAMAQINISQWFVKARGTMLSVCSIVLAIGGAVLIPIIGTMIAKFGYAPVARVEGIVAGGIVVLIGVFIISGPPEKTGHKPFGYEEAQPAAQAAGAPVQTASLTVGQIVATPAFWFVIIAAFIGTLATMSFNSQGASFFESIGLERPQASYALSIFALVGMPWALFFGMVSDKASPSIATLICGGIGSAAFIFAFLLAGWTGAIIGAVAFAAGGAVSGLMGPTVFAKLFGTKEAGSLVGFVRAASALGSMLGSVIAGFLFDKSGSYSFCFMVMGFAFIVAIVLVLLAYNKKTIAKIAAIPRK
jgi:sugar phosphate permease